MVMVPTFEMKPAEAELLERIRFDARTHDELRSSCAAASELTRLLAERKALPSIRTRYLTDPEFNIRRQKSRQQVFETNGTVGRAIFAHPHFLPYLRYFIYGPDLPQGVIAKFASLTAASSFISGEDIPELINVAKVAVRHFGLEPKAAAEEFFKLTIECGGDVSSARMVRDSLMKMRLSSL